MDILLVEDDDLVRDCLAEAVRGAGFTVQPCASGEDAMAWVRRCACPDVLISDINLGQGIDGLSVARSLREICPELPVVFISGRYPTLRGLDPCERFLPKPFSTPALLQAIAAIYAPARPVTGWEAGAEQSALASPSGHGNS